MKILLKNTTPHSLKIFYYSIVAARVTEVMILRIAMFENSAKILLSRMYFNYCYMLIFQAWFVPKIVLFNGFLSDFADITSCVYTKRIILFNLDEQRL